MRRNIYVTSFSKAEWTGPTGKVSWGRWRRERYLLLSTSRVWLKLRAFMLGASLCLSDHTESAVIGPGWQTWRGMLTDGEEGIQVEREPKEVQPKVLSAFNWQRRVAEIWELSSQAWRAVMGQQQLTLKWTTSTDFWVKKTYLNPSLATQYPHDLGPSTQCL